jgi:hypothetical protein
MDYFFRRHKKMNVVEIRGRLTGTEFFDFAHVTPATPGMNAVVTSVVDANGLVPGMPGYVGQVVQINDDTPVDTNPGLISSNTDSIDVNKMGKGAVTTAHSAIATTTTSAEIDCRGFNGILVGIELSAAHNWTIKVQGSSISGGTFKDCYELANTGVMTLMSHQTNSNRIIAFKGIPDYIKIVATEDEDGATCTVTVQPINL